MSGNDQRFVGHLSLSAAELDLAQNILVGATSADWGRGIDAWFAHRARLGYPELWTRCVAFWHYSRESEKQELGVAIGWVEPGRAGTQYPLTVLREFETLSQLASRLFSENES